MYYKDYSDGLCVGFTACQPLLGYLIFNAEMFLFISNYIVLDY